jgi:hypothetical protein
MVASSVVIFSGGLLLNRTSRSVRIQSHTVLDETLLVTGT